MKAGLDDGSGHVNEDEIDLEVLLANMNGIITTRFNYEVNVRQEQDCLDFLKNARNIRLEGGLKSHMLVAEIKSQDGSWVEQRVDLNTKCKSLSMSGLFSALRMVAA